MSNGGRGGTYEVTRYGEEVVRAFVPRPLPPDPPLRMEGMLELLEEANLALGRLDGLGVVLPDPSLFLYYYIRKEAVLSSQIEGTQSSLSDLLLYESGESPTVRIEEVEEVSTYVAAMKHGLERLSEGFPLSLRLMREMHEKLMSRGRGSEKQPGEFRTSQNWIGGTRPGNAAFVPPPPDKVMDCMGALELFLHERESGLPLLVRAALAHVQFETIHPFLDGNGRLGRLLITLLLVHGEAIRAPVLYLSLYLKTHRDRYYELLDRVRTEGDWEAWVEFFLRGVRETAAQAGETAKRILDLFERDRRRLEGLRRAAPTALRLHEHMERNPITLIPKAAKALGLSAPALAAAMGHLRRLGLVEEITGRRRGRVFAYREYLAILNEGTERGAAG